MCLGTFSRELLRKTGSLSPGCPSLYNIHLLCDRKHLIHGLRIQAVVVYKILPVYLVKDSERHEVLGFLWLSVKQCRYRGHSWCRIWSVRRGIFPDHCFRNLRKFVKSTWQNQKSLIKHKTSKRYQTKALKETPFRKTLQRTVWQLRAWKKRERRERSGAGCSKIGYDGRTARKLHVTRPSR